MKYRCAALLLFLLPIFSWTLWSATIPSRRYAVILSAAPVAKRMSSRSEMQSAAGRSYHQQIESAQRSLRAELQSRHIQVTGAVQYLLNAVFVQASPEQAAALKNLPGVKAVIPVRRWELKLNHAVPLVNGPAAWTTLGGVQNAGLGMKIAILDSGIDQTHPAFQDPSLPMPPGFPLCNVPQDCAFTNNKVIVARSYIPQLAAGTQPDPAADSRPDDYSPRDRIGHGTANASVAAGVTNTGPAATITGIAPKAYLGNYKIIGSAELNDFTLDDVIVMALEDALKDGMDVASLSIGGPALTGPFDSGSICGNSNSIPCDVVVEAAENAIKQGMVVVSAAGNEADTGELTPTANTIDSPADAPDVIAAGASTNAHFFVNVVRVPGADVPSSLQQIIAMFGDGPLPTAPVTAPIVDVAQLQNDGLACTALAAGSLNGDIGLIEEGGCIPNTKVSNAQNAGAVGVIIYSGTGQSTFPPGGLAGTVIPAVSISNSAGVELKAFVDSHPNQNGTLSASLAEELNTFGADELAFFSSIGPSAGNVLIKPDLVAPGTQMYMATENFDPLGDMYSPDRYTAGDGTSFATPLVAGAAALVKQKNPNFTPQQIRSALIDTGVLSITDSFGAPGGVNEIGGGKLDANAAISTTITAVPATISFGALTSATTLPLTQSLQIINSGSGTANLSIGVSPTVTDTLAGVKVDQQSLSLGPGATGTVSVTLNPASPGNLPLPGDYEGMITIQGGSVPLHVPYLYMVSDRTPYNIIPEIGDLFDGTVNEPVPDGAIAIKLIDQFGLPVPGVNVTFSVTSGGGSIQQADSTTDQNGVASALPVLGPNPGHQAFTASAAGLSWQFDGTARLKPAIASNGIVDAASFAGGKPVAPGSYISIFGTGLSDDVGSATSLPLPLAIDYVNVSFDVPSAGLSLPGQLLYASPGQVNVQVPWALQGQSSVQVKVTIGFSTSNVYTLPLAGSSPGFFEYTDAGGNPELAALDENNHVIGAGNPAQRGHVVQLYANGLGPVTNQPATGYAAGSDPLSETTTTPIVTIGGQAAAVSFSGLAPGFPALYQVNVAVPEGVTPGTQPVVISIGGAASKPANLVVQ